MSAAPETRYATVGSGPVDILLLSRTGRDRVAGSGLASQPRRVHASKGVPQPWELFAASTGAVPAADA